MTFRAILLALFAAGLISSAHAEEPSLYDLLKEPAYRAAFDQMIAGENLDSWIDSFVETGNGVTAPSTPVTVDGQSDVIGWVCKPHDCGDNQLFVLFSPDGAGAAGMLNVAQSEPRWLGAPSDAAKAALTKASQQ